MYRWRKFVRPKWLNEHEEAVRSRTGNALAIIERLDRTTLLIEAAGQTRRQAKYLVREFGGSVQRLRAGWLTEILNDQKRSPIKIGERLIITDAIPSIGRRKSRRSGDRKILIIPAGGAFGTGEHATTAMCLRLVERITRRWRNDWSMLDAGTGSGILALAAKCLGADRVIAIDHDPRAIAIAKSNARLNRIHEIRFEIADAEFANMHGKVDVITANLFSELLIAAIPKWGSRLRSKGILILSGILRSQERGVVRALHKQRIAIEEIRRRGKWIAIVAHKQKAG